MAYQYTFLPFGLSLAPGAFAKCMDAALSPLRQLGIHILNYLDNWLIFAQSEDELLSHRSMLLSHFCQFQVNCAKSALSPSQRILFLGTVIDSNEGGTCTGHSAARGLIQTRSPSPSQSVSEDDGPHGLSVFGTSVARPWVESTLPFRALRIYIERSAPFRQSEQLFVCFGGLTKGSPVTKQRLSR